MEQAWSWLLIVASQAKQKHFSLPSSSSPTLTASYLVHVRLGKLNFWDALEMYGVEEVAPVGF